MATNSIKLWIIIGLINSSVGLFGGCVASDSPFRIIDGKDYSYRNVDNIVKGKTTKQEILDMFGDPYTKTDNRWIYYFLKERTGKTTIWFLTLNKARQQFRAELEIIFRDNIVDNYIFNSKVEVI